MKLSRDSSTKFIGGGALAWLISQPFKLKLLSLVAIIFIFQVSSINLFPLDFDEGVHLLVARLIERGYRPYTDVFISRLPLFVLMMQGIWELSFGSLFVSKVIFSVLNSLLLIAIGYLGRRLLDEKVGLFSVALLGISPLYTAASVALMADLPAVMLATLALWLGLRYLQSARRRWLFLAGLVFAAALLTKLLVLYMAPILLMLLLTRQIPQVWRDRLAVRVSPSWSGLMLDLGLFLAAGLTLAVPVLIPFDWTAMTASTVEFRLALRETLSFDPAFNAEHLLFFGSHNRLLVIGLIVAPILAYLQSKPVLWLLFMWWFSAFIWLVIQIPLREQHLVVLWGPTVLIAAWSALTLASLLMRGLSGLSSPTRHLSILKTPVARVAPATFLGLCLLGYGAAGWSQLPDLRDRARNIYHQKQINQWRIRPELVDFFQRITTVDDCVISDDAVFIAETNRLPPPALSEPSSARIEGGDLDLSLIKRAALDHQCQAIISINEKFSNGSLPGLWIWAEEFFAHHLEIEGITIYYNEPEQPVTPLNNTFDDLIVLLGYSLNPTAIAPDGTLWLNLYWRPLPALVAPAALTGQEKVFVQLRNNQGETIAQADHVIFERSADTRTWPREDGTFREATRLRLPRPFPAKGAPYRLYTGLYDPGTLTRFPLREDTSGENAVIIDFPPQPLVE